MKQFIKSATVFTADFGVGQDAIDKLLAEKPFRECTPFDLRSVGFLPMNEDTGAMTAGFKNGFAFRVRIDTKTIPASVLNTKTQERVDEREKLEDRKIGKKERAEIKGDVLIELAAQAFPRTAIITCFYQQGTNYLFVPTTSQKLTDAIMTALVSAVGSVKTESIHINNIKHGLTERLRRWNQGDDDAFGIFQPCAEAALQQDERKISIKMGQLRAADTGIKEALEAQFQVTSLGFTHDGETEFRLTHDFKFKSIGFAHTDAEDDEAPTFYAQATLEVDALSAVINDVVDMIGHGKEEGGDTTTEAAE